MASGEPRSGDLAPHVGNGTVFFAFVDDSEYGGPQGWFGYWDLEPDGPPTCLERAELQPTAEAAVAWGRARSNRVLIRDPLGPHGDVYLWAGTGPRPPGVDFDF